MFATQVLPETGFEVNLDENESEIVGILTVGDNQHEIKKGENKIGRDSTICAIVLDNFTVSKLHAVIESEGSDDTFIYDAGSTNQTKLGKKSLKPHCRYKLDNGSIITLGNVVGRFILPFDGNNDCLKTETITPPNSDGRTSVYNGYDELDDIFEVPTQVTIPQPGTSKQFSKFKELQEVFKVPKILPVAKDINGSLEMMENCFDVVTQCQLYSQKSSTEVSSSFQENTDIFNLSTQCQISSASLNEGQECNNKTDNDLDKIKSLLNDGQDDILCTFMSLHSPNGQNQCDIMKPAEIKTEHLSQDLDDILNASTQVNAEFMQEKLDETQEEELNVKINFVDGFSLEESQVETVYIQNEKPKSEDLHEKVLQPKEEDFISTQEFNNEKKVTNNVIVCTNAVEDKSESESYLEITLNDFSITDQINNGEDLILAQESTVSEKQDATSPMVAKLSSCQEDLSSTQPYVVNIEKVNKKIKKESEDADSYLEVTLDSTQTSKEDFINTKVPVISKKTAYLIENNEQNIFEGNEEIETTQLDETSSERDDDDSQDFIATQTFEPLMRNKSKAYGRAFRECSPDILVPAKSPENFCITANLPDLISTRNFGTSECKYRVAEISERIKSEREHMCNDELVFKDIRKFSVSESSGDETESDLEIIMDTIQTPKKKFCLDELKESISVLTKVEISSESPQPKSCQEDDDSNSSYIFQPEFEREEENGRKYSEMDNKRRQRVADSDSDATDCDELEMVSVKPEPLKMVQYEDTQVLTLSLPSNFAEKESDPNDDWMIGKESPRFEPEKESVWILEESQNGELKEMSRSRDEKPSAVQKSPMEKEENESETSRRKEIEIGIHSLVGRITRSKSKSLGTATASHSPLKRVGESKNPETPFKKSKTFEPKQSNLAHVSGRCLRSSERRFSKLWEAHDIAQIQPTRTRNSRKSEDKINDAEKNVITEVKTSYRKSRSKRGDTKIRNTDIPSYFRRK